MEHVNKAAEMRDVFLQGKAMAYVRIKRFVLISFSAVGISRNGEFHCGG